MSDPQTGPVRLTRRRCRYCHHEYRVPQGERRQGCRVCAPSLYDVCDVPAREPAAAGVFVPPNDGIPF